MLFTDVIIKGDHHTCKYRYFLPIYRCSKSLTPNIKFDRRATFVLNVKRNHASAIIATVLPPFSFRVNCSGVINIADG